MTKPTPQEKAALDDAYATVLDRSGYSGYGCATLAAALAAANKAAAAKAARKK